MAADTVSAPRIATAPMRFGDYIWPTMLAAWPVPILLACADLWLGGGAEAFGSLLYAGTLILTPAVFVPLYVTALLCAGLIGWPRRPQRPSARPGLALCLLALGAGFGLVLLFFLAGVWSGGLPERDFCSIRRELDAGGAALRGLTIWVDDPEVRVCRLNFLELAFATFVWGLVLSLVLAPAVLALRLLVLSMGQLFLAVYAAGWLAALWAVAQGSETAPSATLFWVPLAVGLAALPICLAGLHAIGYRSGADDLPRRRRRRAAGILGLAVALAGGHLFLTLTAGEGTTLGSPERWVCALTDCRADAAGFARFSLAEGLPLGGLLLLLSGLQAGLRKRIGGAGP